MNNAATNICLQVSVWTHFFVFLGLCLRVELLDLVVTLYLFEELPDSNLFF